MFHCARGLDGRIVLTVERLEARLVPAVLDLPSLHGDLFYKAGASHNTMTVDESLGQAIITDTEIISLTQDAIDAGWTGHLQYVVSGPTNSFDSLEVWLSKGNDSLHAGSGWETHRLRVFGGLGKDTISGGVGNDRFYGEDGDDELNGGGGNDVLNGGGGDDIVDGSAGDDVLTGGAGDDTCKGSFGMDRLVEQADTNMELSRFFLRGGTVLGRDSLSWIESAQLKGGASGNRLDASAFEGRTTLLGYGGRDTLLGGTSDDELWGHGGADLLKGNEGDDTLDGGGSGANNNDTCQGGAGSDLLRAEPDTGPDMELTDTRLRCTGFGTSELSGIERAQLNLTHGNGGTIDASAFTLGPVTLTGSYYDDTLIGTGHADQLYGMGGDDLLRGLGDNDTLNGGLGTDTLKGGDGTDEGSEGEVEDSIEI